MTTCHHSQDWDILRKRLLYKPSTSPWDNNGLLIPSTSRDVPKVSVDFSSRFMTVDHYFQNQGVSPKRLWRNRLSQLTEQYWTFPILRSKEWVGDDHITDIKKDTIDRHPLTSHRFSKLRKIRRGKNQEMDLSRPKTNLKKKQTSITIKTQCRKKS